MRVAPEVCHDLCKDAWVHASWRAVACGDFDARPQCRVMEEAMTIMAETVPEAAPGFYLMTNDRGFAVHISASPAHLRLVRELAGRALAQAGVSPETAENAQLVASELVGNAVKA